jgi:hypothetical protein
VKESDGSWKPVLKSAVYGNIFSRRFDPVKAQQVRLVIKEPVQRFDLFPPEEKGE